MNKHEAVEFLKNMIGEESGRAIGKDGFYAELCGYHVQALKMAIKALEQEPCEDAISRQAVLDAIDEIDKGACMNEYHAIVKAIEDLPSVTPKQRTGHWIRHIDASGNSWHTCPECGHIAYTLTRFCPDCGMRLETSS